MQLRTNITDKIYTLSLLTSKMEEWRSAGKTIAFTNGCFDILHTGHIASLSAAAGEANVLVVGLNADSSVKRLKGPERPINDEVSRAIVLASLVMIDAVIIFSEDTPLNTILSIRPDVLVKGGDYTIDTIVGAKEIMEYGGRVVVNPLIPGISTTALIDKLRT